MEKVFAALEAKHPGSKLLDFRISVDPFAEVEKNMYDKLAKAIEEAEPVSYEDMCRMFS